VCVMKLIASLCNFANAPIDITVRCTVLHLELWINRDDGGSVSGYTGEAAPSATGK
jgi:hypothetical protein